MKASQGAPTPEPAAPTMTSAEPRADRGDAGRNAASVRARSYAANLAPVLDTIAGETGRTAQILARELTRRAVRKPRGGTVWTPADVRKLLRRLGDGPNR